jgi:DNA-binding GntR family transcriptional regulator
MGLQADQVRKDILDRMLERRLLPGDVIDEAELRDRLSLSATPIREAFIALEATGVVHRPPRGGARVAAFDLEGLVKAVETLAELEGAVAYRAARRISAAQADALRAASDACLQAAAAPVQDAAVYYDLNIGFHRAMIAAAGNETLGAILVQLGNRLVAYLAARHALPGEIRRSAEDHARIVAVVLDSQAEKARTMMMDHVLFQDTVALDVLNRVRSLGQ